MYDAANYLTRAVCKNVMFFIDKFVVIEQSNQLHLKNKSGVQGVSRFFSRLTSCTNIHHSQGMSFKHVSEVYKNLTKKCIY